MTVPDISNLNYSEMCELREQLDDRMKEMRETGITQLRATIAEQAKILDIDVKDLIPKKRGGKRVAKRYQDPENPENVYGGKGRKPQWLKDALAAGRKLEEFLVSGDVS